MTVVDAKRVEYELGPAREHILISLHDPADHQVFRGWKISFGEGRYSSTGESQYADKVATVTFYLRYDGGFVVSITDDLDPTLEQDEQAKYEMEVLFASSFDRFQEAEDYAYMNSSLLEAIDLATEKARHVLRGLGLLRDLGDNS